MAKYTKRRDKRGYEWKFAYWEKEALMLERGYPEVSPYDFYRELFPLVVFSKSRKTEKVIL